MPVPPFAGKAIPLGIAAAAATFTVASAALLPGSQLFGQTIIAGSDPREIALTYDDGPNPACTPELLDLLAAHNVRATFFMIGRFVRQKPELARRVLAAGHLIGNHTETHPWLPLKPEATIREELRACNKALEDALGEPVRYFRPPHGARRPALIRIAAELGLKTVQWNVMAQDWKPIGAAAMLAIVDREQARARRRQRGSNIVLHDGWDRQIGTSRTDTLAVTGTLLKRSAAEGSRFVTVDAWG
jgi:peptidoglycan/xylan/chitin deacetylase (PgdA/CDA1 family)